VIGGPSGHHSMHPNTHATPSGSQHQAATSLRNRHTATRIAPTCRWTSTPGRRFHLGARAHRVARQEMRQIGGGPIEVVTGGSPVSKTSTGEAECARTSHPARRAHFVQTEEHHPHVWVAWMDKDLLVLLVARVEGIPIKPHGAREAGNPGLQTAPTGGRPDCDDASGELGSDPPRNRLDVIDRGRGHGVVRHGAAPCLFV